MSTVVDSIEQETPVDERFQALDVSTIAFGHATHDTYTSFLAPLLPELILKFALSTTQAGLLSVLTRWPSVLQPFIGHLADHASLRYFVILSPAVTATMMSLLGVAPSYAVLALFLIVAGLSSASLHAVGPVMAGRISGRNLGRGMGFWMVGGELGRTLGPIIIVSAVTLVGLAGSAWLMIGGWLASAMLYVRLRNISGRPTDVDRPRPWRQALRTMRPLLVPLSGIVLVRAFVSSSLTTYLPTFLSREGANLWFAGASLSVLEAAGVVGALTGGSLSDRLGRRRILLISMLATPVLMLGFLGTAGWERLPLLLLLGFTTLSVTPVILALVQESFPQNRALANGVYMALSFLISSGTILVVGMMGDAFGLRKAFTISAVLPLLGVPLILLLPRSQSS